MNGVSACRSYLYFLNRMNRVLDCVLLARDATLGDGA